MNEEKQTEQVPVQLSERLDPVSDEIALQSPSSKKKHVGFTIYLAVASALLLFLAILPYLFVATVPGGGWLMFILFPIFILAGILAALNYLVIAPYLILKRPGIRLVAFGIGVLLVSFPVAYYGAAVALDFRAAEESARQAQEDDEREERAYIQKRAALSEVNVEQATELLNSCDVVGFYTVDKAAPHDAKAVEASATGIVVNYISREDRFRMYAANRMAETLEPIVENAQYRNMCEGLEIGRDGVYSD